MMRKLIFLLLMVPVSAFGQTLEACQQAAEHNYPLIRQYGVVEKTTAVTESNLRKGWLPQLSATAQVTYQSAVTAFPDDMQSMYQQMGITMEGLSKSQYRIGLDVQQSVYDGGNIRSQKEIARRQGEVQAAQNEVNLYNVRKRVNELFFSLLMVEEQIKLNADLQALLSGNEKKLASMLKGGTAAESDYQNVKAERLNAVQQMTGLHSQRTSLVRMLSLLCGMEIKAAVKPVVRQHTPSTQTCLRPELKAIDAQLKLVDSQERALDAALRPRLGVFAQGYYGYPGYNMFDDMMRHRLSWNGMIGARLTWNIGALYTRKNDKARLQFQRETAEVSRDRFLFDNRLEQIGQQENIERYRKQVAEDDEIIALRSSIRKAAESKLAHGIIDVNDLLKEINNENVARVQQAMHEIEMLKEIYDLKFTTNQ